MDRRIPVVVIKELSETDTILTALQNYGINCAEITFRTACAAEAIAYACKKYPEMNIGAGTVINAARFTGIGLDDPRQRGECAHIFKAFEHRFRTVAAVQTQCGRGIGAFH